MSCFKPVTAGKPALGEQSQHPTGGWEGCGVRVCSSCSELGTSWLWMDGRGFSAAPGRRRRSRGAGGSCTQLAGTMVCWDQLVKHHRLLHPQDPQLLS